MALRLMKNISKNGLARSNQVGTHPSSRCHGSVNIDRYQQERGTPGSKAISSPCATIKVVETWPREQLVNSGKCEVGGTTAQQIRNQAMAVGLSLIEPPRKRRQATKCSRTGKDKEQGIDDIIKTPVAVLRKRVCQMRAGKQGFLGDAERMSRRFRPS